MMLHKRNESAAGSGQMATEPTPGQLLVAAREHQGLTQEIVAERLYLKVQQVKALEADQYASAPALIYVRGYLRNYAKLLEIPEERVINAFEKIVGKTPCEMHLQVARRPVQKFMRMDEKYPSFSFNVNRWPVSWMVLFGLILIVSLGLGWWTYQKKWVGHSFNNQAAVGMAGAMNETVEQFTQVKESDFVGTSGDVKSTPKNSEAAQMQPAIRSQQQIAEQLNGAMQSHPVARSMQSNDASNNAINDGSVHEERTAPLPSQLHQNLALNSDFSDLTDQLYH